MYEHGRHDQVATKCVLYFVQIANEIVECCRVDETEIPIGKREMANVLERIATDLARTTKIHFHRLFVHHMGACVLVRVSG